MKKVFCAMVVVLLATPLWADVVITATDLGGGVVAIDYNNVSSTQLVRAFALDIKVDNGEITGISDYAIGDENYGYGQTYETAYYNYLYWLIKLGVELNL